MIGKLKRRGLPDRETTELLIGLCAIVIFALGLVLLQQRW